MFQKRGSLQELRILPQGVRKLPKASLKEDAPKVPPPPEKSLKAAKSKPNSLFSPGFTIGRAPIRAAPPPYTPSIVSASEPRDSFPSPSPEYSSGNINFCSAAERWLDAMAAPLGGHDIIDSRILNHIPTLYLFVTETRLKDFMLTNRPSKFVFLLVILAILQALIPALEIPLDAMAQILYVSFTWHENAHVQLRPVPMLLTHLVSSARHLLPYAWLGLDKFAIPSLLMLVITFGLFMCPRNLRRPQAPGSDRSPTETFGTVVETFLCPQVGPLVELTGVAVQAERAKRYLCEANDSDTYGLLKLGFASGLLLFGTSMFSRTLAELGFRLTWWLLTIKTLLVLEGLRTSAPNAESEAHHVLLVWSIRLILHAFETAHVPLVGVIGSTAIASIPMYYPAVTVAVLALLYREDVRDIKCGIADEHELYHPRRCHSAEI